MILEAPVAVESQPVEAGPLRSTRLVLASRSPRRRELLRGAGIDHDASAPPFEDGVLQPGNATPERWVMSLAYLKAWSMVAECGPGRVVLGADTACVQDGRLIGTPRDADEAMAIIRGFAGRAHDVVTGAALIETSTGRRRMFADRATVTFGTLDDRQVHEYAASGLWAGKAGAYNLAERLAAGWPIEFVGDAETIMGLPVTRLRTELDLLRRDSLAF